MPPTGMRLFRFIYSGENDGYTNMAMDEAVMTGLKEGSSTPVLRIYKWKPPTISIGYFQSASEIDFDRCALDGIGVVRRITGGRAVLHHDELTYSILFGLKDFAPFRKKEIFFFIASCLVESLKLFGIDSKIAEKTRGDLKSPDCFAAPAQFEIESAREGKLIGSAQVIKNGVVLQHGAIPLTDKYRTLEMYLKGGAASARNGEPKQSSSLAGETGNRANEQSLLASLKSGFGKLLNMQNGELSALEWERTVETAKSRYAQESWMFRK